MSHFPNGIVYIIVPTIDVTTEMVNEMKRSFTTCLAGLRKSSNGNSTLLKTREPVSAVFNGLEWYNETEILVILEGGSWD